MVVIHFEKKKKLNKVSTKIEKKPKKESEKMGQETTNNSYNYNYWNRIIDGAETIEIDKSEVSSQVLLDNWDFVSKYYYVLREEVKAMRNDTNLKEEQIVYDLSFNHDLTKALYKRNLDLIQPTLCNFLVHSLENKHKLRKPEANLPLTAISIIFFLEGNYNLSLSVEPSRTFHNEKYSNHEPEFKFKHEFTIDIDKIESAMLSELNVNVGDYYDDYEEYTYDLFSEMMFECWNKAKQKTNSTLIGSLIYGSGGINYDLDARTSIDVLDIGQYYKNKGIKIEKHLED